MACLEKIFFSQTELERWLTANHSSEHEHCLWNERDAARTQCPRQGNRPTSETKAMYSYSRLKVNFLINGVSCRQSLGPKSKYAPQPADGDCMLKSCWMTNYAASSATTKCRARFHLLNITRVKIRMQNVVTDGGRKNILAWHWRREERCRCCLECPSSQRQSSSC